MKERLAVVGLAAPAEVGFDQALNVTRMTADSIRDTEVEVFCTELVMSDYESAERVAFLLDSEDIAAVLVCVATWSDDNYVLQFLKRLEKPIIFHAYPAMETGSLCGVMQIASVLKDIRVDNYRTVYAEVGSEESVKGIVEAFFEIINKKNDTKAKKESAYYIGSIGGRAAGMTEIAFDEFALYEKLGALVVNINETELLEEVNKVSNLKVISMLPSVINRGFHIDVSEKDIKESLKYYYAMKEIIARYGLVGLAVKCYTKYMGKVCLGYSLLADEGYACACEGDVNSAVMMKILKDLTGQCVNNADILNPLPDTNEIIFAHCGSSGFSIAPNADEVHLTNVRLMDSGVCSMFRPKLGTVTAADLVGHGDNLRMSVMVGEAVEKEYLFPGNQACIRFERPVVDICKDVIKKSCGHHWMIGYGDFTKELEEFCKEHDIIFQNIT